MFGGISPIGNSADKGKADSSKIIKIESVLILFFMD
jgi:hypothetical protein